MALGSTYRDGINAALAVYKLASIKTPLQPHQQRVIDRIQQDDQPGLVVAHGLGSGKTLTSIAAQDALNMPADVVVPAALQGNYAKEIKKHTVGKGPGRNIESLQNAAAKGLQPRNKMLIVDEAHRARDSGSKTYQALATNTAQKRMLLTGSPFYNHPADLAPLLNLAAGKMVQPGDQTSFEKRYIHQQRQGPGLWGMLRGVKPGYTPQVNKAYTGELKDTYKKWVDYHPGSSEGFPSVTHENINVPMSKKQQQVYDTLLDQAPPWVSYKIKHGLPPSKTEAQQLNAFLTGTRQVSNTTAPFQSKGEAQDPKIETAFNNLKTQLDANPQAKAVVYSNFLNAGIDPYKKRMDAAGIPYGEFTGAQSKTDRDNMVKQYNDNKLRALLISSAGGEGLDLQGTRLMQILDPHWNNEKLRQVEGRGVRYKSHDMLPEADRNVRMEHYLSTRIPSGLLEQAHLRKPGGSVDTYLNTRSKEKDDLINQFKALLPQEQST